MAEIAAVCRDQSLVATQRWMNVSEVLLSRPGINTPGDNAVLQFLSQFFARGRSSHYSSSFRFHTWDKNIQFKKFINW